MAEGASLSCTTTPNLRHVLTYLRPKPVSPLPLTSLVYKLASLANKPNREWLINSSAYPRTAPYSLNPKSSTVYPFSNQQKPFPHKHSLHLAQPAHTTMLSDSLYSLARSKLHLSTSSKDSSLHRWVLIKNSIVNSLSSTPPPALPDTNSNSVDEDDDDADEVLDSVEVVNSFMFPDAGKLVNESTTEEAKASEAQWLDSLLETLGDDDDDDFSVDSEHNISTLPADDDEFPLYSPIVSPMSSSDDLPSDSYYPTSSISVPYPPYHPPLIHAYDFDTTFEPLEPLVSSFSAPYEDPLPYHNLDDLEDVPDAIEDTSDDESDAPTTPSLGRSSSSLTLDPASVPLPAERSSRLRHSDPRVYIDVDDQYFRFEIDPLPFFDEHLTTSYNQC